MEMDPKLSCLGLVKNKLMLSFVIGPICLFLFSSGTDLKHNLAELLEKKGLCSDKIAFRAIYVLLSDNFRCYACSGYEELKERGVDVVLFVPPGLTDTDLNNFRVFNQIDSKHPILRSDAQIEQVAQILEAITNKKNQSHWILFIQNGKLTLLVYHSFCKFS